MDVRLTAVVHALLVAGCPWLRVHRELHREQPAAGNQELATRNSPFATRHLLFADSSVLTMHPRSPATSNQQLAEGDERLAAGVRLFNEERFFEAHEAWEELWLHSEGEQRTFLQGLIQLAAAYHHLQRGTTRGAGRLFDAALEKLSSFSGVFLGVDCADALISAAEDRARLRDGKAGEKNSPKIRYN